jgi:hypothetical protein
VSIGKLEPRPGSALVAGVITEPVPGSNEPAPGSESAPVSTGKVGPRPGSGLLVDVVTEFVPGSSAPAPGSEGAPAPGVATGAMLGTGAVGAAPRRLAASADGADAMSKPAAKAALAARMRFGRRQARARS